MDKKKVEFMLKLRKTNPPKREISFLGDYLYSTNIGPMSVTVPAPSVKTISFS